MSATLFVLANLIVLGLVSLIYSNSGIFVVGLIGFIISFLFIEKQPSLMLVAFIGNVIAILFIIFNYYALINSFGSPYYAVDDQLFEQYGHWLFTNKVYLFEKIPYMQGMYFAKGYCLVLCYIERLSYLVLSEYHTLAPRVLNIYLWASSSYIIQKMVQAHTSFQYSKKVFLLLFLFPNALFISSFVYRDTLVVFLMVLFIYSLENVFQRAKRFNGKFILDAALLILSIYLLYYVRVQMIYILGVIAAFYLADSIFDNKRVKVITYGLATIAGLLLLFFSGAFDLFSITEAKYSDLRADQTDGLSSVIFSQNLIPFGIILRFIYGFFIPFPAGIFDLNFLEEPLFSSLRTIVYLGTVFQLFFIPYFFKSIKSFSFETICYIAVYLAIITTTFTFRHFLITYPFLAIVTSEEYYKTSASNRKQIKEMVYISLFALILIYLFLKLIVS